MDAALGAAIYWERVGVWFLKEITPGELRFLASMEGTVSEALF